MIKAKVGVIGGYELIDPIDEKHFGSVYKARCVSAETERIAEGQIVALKILGNFPSDSPVLSSFDKLGKALVEADHPNIVPHLDFFVISANDSEVTPVLIMEYVEGETLAKKIAKNRKGIEPKSMAKIMKECVSGLLYAGEKNILPRFIKKSNIIFGPDDSVKLAGFGSPYIGTSSGTTVVGEDGFFDYVAPEFSALDPCGDQTSNIFSLGMCFFEAFTGKLPYPKMKDLVKNGDNLSGYAGCYLSRWRDGIGPELSDPGPVFKQCPQLKVWLKTCLQPDRAARYQDFKTLRGSLADVFNEMDPSLVDADILAAAGTMIKPAAPKPTAPQSKSASDAKPRDKKKPKIVTPDLSKAGPVMKKRGAIKTPDLSSAPNVKAPVKASAADIDLSTILSDVNPPSVDTMVAPTEAMPTDLMEAPPAVEKPAEVKAAKPQGKSARPAPMAPKKGVSPAVIGGIAVVLILVGGGAAYMAMKGGSEEPPAKPNLLVAKGGGVKQPVKVGRLVPDRGQPATPNKSGPGVGAVDPKTTNPESSNVDPSKPKIPRPGSLKLKAYSSDMEDWNTVVQKTTRVFEEYGEIIFNDPELNTEWDNLLGSLASQIEKSVAAQDPITTRLDRLNEAEFFLRKQAGDLLGERAIKIIKTIEAEKDNFIIRIVNQTGDTLTINVAGVPKPLQVPLNKVKRFKLNVGPNDRDTIFKFSGLTWAGNMERKIHLVRGGGQDLVLDNLTSAEGSVPLTVQLEDVNQGDPPIEIEYKAGTAEAGGAWSRIEDRVETEVQPGDFIFRFSRLDYEPILKQLEVPAGSKDFVVAGPLTSKWIPKPALKKLIIVETAWQKVDKAILKRELDQSEPKSRFEWKGHKIRMDQARERWLREIRVKGRDLGKNNVSLKLEIAQPKGGDGPEEIQAAYRSQGASRWLPVIDDAKLPPGLYEVKFSRPQYEPIVKSINAKLGIVTLRVDGPALNEWKKSS